MFVSLFLNSTHLEMGIEARRAAAGRTKKASPPILSHEFIIQNHGDIMSCILMLIVLGFMFQVKFWFYKEKAHILGDHPIGPNYGYTTIQ